MVREHLTEKITFEQIVKEVREWAVYIYIIGIYFYLYEFKNIFKSKAKHWGIFPSNFSYILLI